MKVQMKFLILGFALAFLSCIGIVVVFLLHAGKVPMIYREQVLPSGKIIKVTSFHLVWGIEHDDRNTSKDSFALEYISSVPHAEPQVRDQEALEVFELIRPISEQWGFNTATISVFQSTQRKGAYDIFVFTRSSDGMWSFNRYPAKVHIND